MIRVRKSSTAPSSLTTTAAYDGEDVKKQLLEDQYDKCYICERSRDTDFEIEHYKSEKKYPLLRQEWSNLFMGCGYCNRKKSDSFDYILNPINENIEDEIEQRIDFVNKKALFLSPNSDDAHKETIELLGRIYNGTKGIRKFKDERFFERALSTINRFNRLIREYLRNPNDRTEKAVRDELAVDKELLGFKYWIIRDSPDLYKVFARDMVWNKA